MAPDRTSRRRVLKGLLLSFAVHGALLLVLVLTPPRSASEAPSVRPIAVEIFHVEPAAPAHGGPAAERRTPAPRRGGPRASTPAGPPADAPLAARGEGAGDGAPGGTGRGLVLTPGWDVLGGRGASEGGVGYGRGHTVKNGPGEAPDPVAVREYEGEVLQRRLGTELERAFGTAQRGSGLLPRYFTSMEEGINDLLQAKQRGFELGVPAVKEFLDVFQIPMEQYGKTGSPVTDPSQTRELEKSGLYRAMEKRGNVAGSPGQADLAQDINRAMQSMVAMDSVVRAARRVRLKAVLRLVQDGSGALAEASFVEQSGNREFDEHVLHLARQVLRDQGTLEDGDTPYVHAGWQSLWQFTYEPPEVKAKLLSVSRKVEGQGVP